VALFYRLFIAFIISNSQAAASLSSHVPVYRELACELEQYQRTFETSILVMPRQQLPSSFLFDSDSASASVRASIPLAEPLPNKANDEEVPIALKGPGFGATDRPK
jgi:hypothetical protein